MGVRRHDNGKENTVVMRNSHRGSRVVTRHPWLSVETATQNSADHATTNNCPANEVPGEQVLNWWYDHHCNHSYRCCRRRRTSSVDVHGRNRHRVRSSGQTRNGAGCGGSRNGATCRGRVTRNCRYCVTSDCSATSVHWSSPVHSDFSSTTNNEDTSRCSRS